MIKEGFVEKAVFEPSRDHGQNLNRRHRAKRTPSGRNGRNKGLEKKKYKMLWRVISDHFG